ncbi:hypothetical protein [Flavobacterium hungaricum]|uniref:PH domain-containing protein n=1 Tax=Flavobacterium hungaricum TaxID=2082725 RepID=A0ABR9TJ59_9FLAO|nr:hypothetical protein [Flavobacterium hungaricum]MBE8725381.1 hypothetical protein [Flavobacterium hungaricum]
MIFKRNNQYLLYRILLSHILILFIAIGGNLTYTNFLPIWILFVMLPNLMLSFFKNLKTIETNHEEIKLVFNIYFFKRVSESYLYTDIRFTYKDEYEGSNSRGMKFRIYGKDSNKSIISLGGLIDGWSEEKITEIIMELQKKGIEVL